MRWLPRRRTATDGVSAGREQEAPDASVSAFAPGADGGSAAESGYVADSSAARARPAVGAGHWRRLPPLAPTVRRAPLTAADSMGVLATGGNISALVHAPASGSRGSAGSAGSASASGAAVSSANPWPGADVRPTVGRVTGIAAARAAGPAEPASESLRASDSESSGGAPRRQAPAIATPRPEPAVLPEPPPAAPASRLVPRVLPSAGPRPRLVEARDEYVGEPVAEATPYASSAWLRMVEAYRPPWASGGDGTSAAPPGAPLPTLPSLSSMPSLPPIPEAGATWSSEAVLPPARRETRADPAKSGSRRASLAESRRLGLGNPLRSAAVSSGESDASDGSAAIEGSDLTGASAPSAAAIGGGLDTADRLRQGLVGSVDDQHAGQNPVEPAPRRLGLGAPVAGAPTASQAMRSQVLRSSAPEPEPEAAPDAGPEPGPGLNPASGPGSRVTPSPVYRFVSGGRPAATVRAVVRQSGTPALIPLPDPLPAQPPSPGGAAGSGGPEIRPLTHPQGSRRSDDAPTATEPPASASVPVEHAASQSASQSAPQAVPFDLAEAVRRGYGTDVSDVPVHRGPEADDGARALGARAFTRDGEVYLPADQGPLDQPVARGLLAHELAHAAQQRAFGSALPAEHTAAGRALEAAAADTERWARGMGAEPSAAFPTGDTTAASWTAPWLTAPSSGRVQRQTDDIASAPAFSQAVDAMPAGLALPTSSSPNMSTNSRPDTAANPARNGMSQALATAVLEQPVDDASEAAFATASSLAAQAAGVSVPFDAELAFARDRLIDLAKRRPLDLDDQGDVDELAGRVYQKISRRLRRELLVDRERAGRLRETGPFG